MLTIKQNDNRNAIEATLIKNDKPVDLTGCDVFISISDKIYRGNCIIESEEEGQVFYPIDQSVTQSTGFFNYEFIVKYQDGREETFPNNGYLKLQVVRRIKGAD